MPTTNPEAGPNDPSAPRRRGVWLFTVIQLLLVIAVLVAAALIVMRVTASPPQAERRAREERAQLVDVIEVQRGDHPIRIQAWGEVIPAREVTLRPRVNGEVIDISPELVPGGRFAAGDVLLRIDPQDYRLAVRQREAELARARADLALEQGNQAVAKREYALLGEDLPDRERLLVLREPQLQQVKASVANAEAALAQAELNLKRTTLRAPFNALVVEREVNRGTRLTTSSDIATLVGTDEYWVELAIPVAALRWIDLPQGDESGSPVRLRHDQVWAPGQFRQGRVIRLLGDLTEEGRMARVLVAIRDPLAQQVAQQGRPPLLLGSFVRGEIQGQRLAEVIVLERSVLRDGKQVWVMDRQDRLRIRPVEIVYKGAEKVFIGAGLAAGERVVTSDVSAAAEGMALRVTADR